MVNSYEFPIQNIREQFPALNRSYKGKPVIYFDGPGGSQVVRASIDSIAQYMVNGGANLHGQSATSRETEAIIAEAKQAVADLFGASANEVAFGANMTTLTFAISRALSRNWKKGDELVVTELDHRANVDPWIAVAEDLGLVVRWLRVDPVELTLDLSELNSIITEKTRLVAVGLASNGVGTINQVEQISRRAREMGALVFVDAVHATPHFSVQRNEIGADILLCSAYKFFGPHVGIAVIRSDVFETIDTYKLLPAPKYCPDKLETGTQNHEGIAGITPAIDFIAGLGLGTTRAEKLVSGFRKIEEYEDRLAEKIRTGLGTMPKVKLYQAKSDVRKTPTIAFEVEGVSPVEVFRYMAEEQGIFIADGDFYATTLADLTSVNLRGGWVRVGLAPYNTEDEVDRFLGALREFIASNCS